jgi:murein DD-endopeptidase MepM/ murein hydrolase activator NlpD
VSLYSASRLSCAISLALIALCVQTGCRARQGPPASRFELRQRHRVHVVAKGESAWGISRKYGVQLSELVALNELGKRAQLFPGDRLLIPGTQPSSESQPPPTKPKRPEPEVTQAGTTPASSGPKAPDLTAGPRPKTRTCRQVEPWLDPPSAVSRKGFSWPVDGVVITKYGKKDGIPHVGIAIAAPLGTVVRAAADGKVVFSDVQGGFGKLVLLAHSGNRVSVYAHHHVSCVKAGQKVARGEVLGLVGQTGGTQSPYLYFEVRDGTKTINPRVVLP